MSTSFKSNPLSVTLRLRLVTRLAVLAIAAFCSGCKLFTGGATFEDGEIQYEAALNRASQHAAVQLASQRPPIERNDLLHEASRLEAANDPACVDLYFAATCRQWHQMAALGELPGHYELLEEAQVYNGLLAKLLVTAQRFCRLDPATGLHVLHDGELVTVPVKLYGFAWTAEDFNELELVGEYQLAKNATAVRFEGVGVPLLVKRCRDQSEPFFRKVQPFAATAVLRTRTAPQAECTHSTEPIDPSELVLEYYNPMHCRHLAGANRRWTVAGDLTAPFAWIATVHPNHPVATFLRPDSFGSPGQLVMLEPYRRGKIPVVFVHGLVSDPTTWLYLINALNAQDWFREHYQPWVYRYDSGMPFLVCAATLRRELNAVRAYWPAAAEDPAADQMVLVGHSLGGLVSKLQVTESGPDLWNIVADRPLDQIQASDTDRERLREVFFFEPQPFVRRVVFIGTPHRGSSMASQTIGRVSSMAVRLTTEADERHRRIVADNPGVFAPWIAWKVPNSVDLLQPDHPLLKAIEKLPLAADLEFHSVIGVADTRGMNAPSDGVVAYSSAHLCGAATEKLIPEEHTMLHRTATTAIEVEQILTDHLGEYEARFAPIRLKSTAWLRPLPQPGATAP